MTSDEPIPHTGSKWATMVNGDIPRSRREDCYKPPLKLSDFEAHIRATDIYAPVKAAILAEIEAFKGLKRGNGRG